MTTPIIAQNGPNSTSSFLDEVLSYFPGAEVLPEDPTIRAHWNNQQALDLYDVAGSSADCGGVQAEMIACNLLRNPGGPVLAARRAGARFSAVSLLDGLTWGAASEGAGAELSDAPQPLPSSLRGRSKFRWLGREVKQALGRRVVSASVVGEGATPSYNMGWQSAEGEQSNGPEQPQAESKEPGVLVDWFSFTYHQEQSQEQLVSHLKTLLGDDWIDKPGTFNFYQSGVMCGNIRILWNGLKENMGVHVQMSGQGCRELEGRHKASTGAALDWSAWADARFNEGADLARVDAAFDVFDGSIDIAEIKAAFLRGEVVSRFNAFEPVEKFNADGTFKAHGFNFGERAQDASIVVYDKAIQQQQQAKSKRKKKDAPLSLDKQDALEQGWKQDAQGPEKSEVPSEWKRVELRLRNDRAHVLMQRVIKEGWGVVAGVLRGYLEFKVPGDNQQKCRWETAPWWLAFLGQAEKTRLKVDGQVKTLQRSLAWLEQQGGAVLGMASQAVPDFLQWVASVAAKGTERFGVRHLAMLSAYAGVRGAAVQSSSFGPVAGLAGMGPGARARPKPRSGLDGRTPPASSL